MIIQNPKLVSNMICTVQLSCLLC